MRRRSALKWLGGVGGLAALTPTLSSARAQVPAATHEGDESGRRPVADREIVVDQARMLSGSDGKHHVFAVAISPDGRFVAAGDEAYPPRSEYAVRVWDAATGVMDRVLSGHRAVVTALAFSPDAERIASGGPERLVDNGRGALTVPQGGVVKVWDRATGCELFSLPGHETSVRAVTYGRLIAALDRDYVLKSWDPKSGEEFRTLAGLKGQGQGGWSPDCGIAFNREATRAVAISDTVEDSRDSGWRTLKRWDLLSGSVQTERTYAGAFGDVAFSPDGNQYATGSRDHTIVVRDFQTGKVVRSFGPPESAPIFLTFSPDGWWIFSGDVVGVLRMWRSESGRLIRTITGPRGHVRAIAFLPNRLRIVSGGGVILHQDPGASAPKVDPLKVWDVPIELSP